MLPRSVRLSSTTTLGYQSISRIPFIIIISPSSSSNKESVVNRHRAMATSSRVQLSPKDCGVYHLPGIRAESAAKASELLQENHDHHHIYFNQAGFHSKRSALDNLRPTGLPSSPRHHWGQALPLARTQSPVFGSSSRLDTFHPAFYSCLVLKKFLPCLPCPVIAPLPT